MSSQTTPNPAPRAPSPGPGILTLAGASRSFGDHQALWPLDLAVGPGGVTGLLGPNGSGKSTLLRMCLGLVPRDRGTITLDGETLVADGVAVRRRASYAPGEISLVGGMRGTEHLAWLLRGRGRDALRRGRAMADGLGLPLKKKVRTFSHGMKRQLLFSAAMAPEVPIRILDEPSDGLDPSKRGTMLEFLTEDTARGTTILLSSHHLGEVDAICDRLLFLHEGRLIADEDSTAIRRRASRTVRLAWTEDPGSSLDSRLKSFGAEQVLGTGLERSCLLANPDPRLFLGRICQGEIPAPSVLEFGRLSLTDLYRDLYGVEGL